MNVRGIILMGFLLMGTVVSIKAQSYERLWEKVEEFEKKDLPKSVVEEVRIIYAKAEKEKNVPQMMKAFLTMTVYRNEISPDSLQIDLKKLETWADSPQTALPDKAVLFSILGEMVLTKGMETLPEDVDKACKYLNKSLEDSLTLVDFDAGKFSPVVVSEETSRRYFDDNLYELLARRAISLWERNRFRIGKEKAGENIRQTYQSLLNVYQKKGIREAWLLTALDAFPDADKATLQRWVKEYGDLDVCAEVYLRLSRIMYKEENPSERLVLIREGITRYAHYERINALKEMEWEILSPRLNLMVDYAYPNKPVSLKINYRNLEGFKLMLYRVNLGVASSFLSQITPQTIAKYGTLLRQEHVSIPATPDYQDREENIGVDVGNAGIYYLVAEPDGYRNLQQGALLHLTSFMLAQRGVLGNCQEMVVLDKESGHPVPYAKVELYERKEDGYVFDKSFTADGQGMVHLKEMGNRTVFCRACTELDMSMPIQRERLTQAWNFESHEVAEYVRLFTDRAIYRPGQRLHYSGIVYNQMEDSVWVKSANVQTIVLLDPNGEKVAEQQVKTDDFGTFQGTFELPVSGMGGVFRLNTGKGMTTVRVEAYKRPTFEVVFEPVKQVYQAGDSLRIQGLANTFAGVAVQGAVVKYKVSCIENRFGRIRGVTANQVTGQTITDDKGRFEVPVHLLPVEKGEREWFYTYEIMADVTALVGETQTGTMDLPLCSSSLRMFVPDWEGETMVKEHRKALKFVVTNLKHVPVETMVDYELYTVEEKEDGNICPVKQVCQGKMQSNRTFVPDFIYDLPSGQYQLKAMVKDEAGRTNECTVTFVLFSLEDGKMPVKASVWYYQSDQEFDENGNATICFGSSEKDVHLFYDVYSNGKWIERKQLEFSDSLLTFPFNYKEEYGDGLCVSFFFGKHGRLYARYIKIIKPRPDKSLQMTWKTFRDKLQPGSRETWTLNIKGTDGKTADAQLMATLYDESLEQIVKHKWQMKLNFIRYIPTYYWTGTWSNRLYWGFPFPRMKFEYAPLTYSYIDIPKGSGRGRDVMRMYKSAAVSANIGTVTELKYVPPEVSTASGETEVVLEEETSLDVDKVELRTNFAETAFFYPQLRTDTNGEVNIDFTLPESLTTWKFMGLAHTREMEYGELSASVTASKDFMLQPHLPRFVRTGDEVSFTASLMNLTEKEIKGKVRMELYNPETEKVWMVQKKSFHVSGNGTDTVQFSFKVKDEYEVLACRMVAEGGRFSDGEQRYLPVLTDKQWVTESVSIDVDKAGTYRIPLVELFNHHSPTVSHPRMVVEFTGSPAWYAVQALPVLAEPANDNALSWAAAYYANKLAGYIVQSNPKIRQVVENWKMLGKDVSSSPLQKNEELKDLLLEETPWLSDAMDETEQRQQLVTLFDSNTMNYRNLISVNKLKELQNENGSWSWYKGMPGNRYMTTQIVELLARLQTMVPQANCDQAMMASYRKAFEYLKKQVRKEYERMREMEREQLLLPSEQTLRYLYICALDASLQPEKTVNDYFIRRLEAKSAQLTIYGKSLAAVILHHSGYRERADEFLQSVMEYSVVSEKMGRYFDTAKAPASWFSYQIPTEVMALEAILRLQNDENTVEQMKRWLLKQKQTQVWNMPIATVDAIYALLMDGSDWLEQNPSAELVLGEETISVPYQQALNYVKQEVGGNVMSIDEVVIRKETDGMAWGAVYAQFLENMDKTKVFSNGLSVFRSLWKNGVPVSSDTLDVGDRITVRLTVSADRNMDFVQLKDERAACMEPVDVLSSYRWKNGIGYYQVTKDATTRFFFDQLQKGTHVLEYDVYISAVGDYQQGVASVQSVYAPEFEGHSSARRIHVK